MWVCWVGCVVLCCQGRAGANMRWWTLQKGSEINWTIKLVNNDPIKRESQSCYHRQHRQPPSSPPALWSGHIPLHCHLLWKLGTTRYQELYYRVPLLTKLAKYHQILDIKCKDTLTLYHEDSTHKTSSNEPSYFKFQSNIVCPLAAECWTRGRCIAGGSPPRGAGQVCYWESDMLAMFDNVVRCTLMNNTFSRSWKLPFIILHNIKCESTRRQ